MLSKEYLKSPRMNQSSLKHILKGDDEFKHKLDTPSEKMTDAQIIGSAFHLFLLQPHLSHTVIKKPKISGNTREGKIFKLLMEGKNSSFFPIAKGKIKKQEEGLFYEVDEPELVFIYQMVERYPLLFTRSEDCLVLDEDDYHNALRMSESALKNDDTRKIIESCTHFEHTIQYKHKKIKFKAQLDGKGYMFVCDAKSTSDDMNDRMLLNTIKKNGYDFQGASYLIGEFGEEIFDEIDEVSYYIFFTKSSPPFTTIPYKLKTETLMEGFIKFNEACDRYNWCLENNPYFIANHKLRAI